MVNSEFFEAVKVLSKERKLSEEELCAGIQKAIVIAFKANYNNKDIVFCDIDPEEETIRVYVRKNVVEEINDPDEDILVEQARQYKADAEPGDFIDIDIDTKEVSRISAEKGKHVLRQGIREAEVARRRAELAGRGNEIVTVKVHEVDPETGDAYVQIGVVHERIRRREQIPTDSFKKGDRVKVHLVEVREKKGLPVVILSRARTAFVRSLFETEVPEVYDGTVLVRDIARETGERSKVAVYSTEKDVDPVGACIGNRSERINAILDALGGEKIDIIKYSSDPAEYVAAALAPAEVISVTITDRAQHKCQVIVPNDKLSLAIGNNGQNARLAARLTGWKIDIKPETEQKEDVINYDV